MEIRRAKKRDAAAICDVVRRSIAVLCVLDHRSDPEVLARWLANKQPETVARWIANPANRMFVAVEAREVLAAGCVTELGEVTLNYVSPDARFRGASRALLDAMEACARDLGISEVRLISTTTALRFYRDAGYLDDGAPSEKHGVASWPLRKAI
jgi:N-acetylglutamate synthase-like GNAT family acetyltransferase